MAGDLQNSRSIEQNEESQLIEELYFEYLHAFPLPANASNEERKERELKAYEYARMKLGL